MTSIARSPWRVVVSTTRVAPVITIRNGRKDRIAVVYTNPIDAQLMAESPALAEALSWALMRLDSAGLGHGAYFSQASATLARARGEA